MTRDDPAARHARAKSLREEIARLREGAGPGGASPPDDEAPRDFIERRARELDEQSGDPAPDEHLED